MPPDSVRCTRGRTLQIPQLRVSRRSSAIIHRIVPCTSGATAICAQRSTLTNEQCSTVTRQKSEQKVREAPDCPVPHEDKASNGRPAPSPNDRVTWRRTGHCLVAHRTVWCAHRQQPSPTATIWFVAINTTQPATSKGGSPNNIPSHIVDISEREIGLHLFLYEFWWLNCPTQIKLD
jgi:hypothetical protein